MARGKRRRYTAEEQVAAVADAARLGVCEAAKAHGMPQSCVSRWASQKRKQPAKRKHAKAEISPAEAKAVATEVVPGRAARATALRYTPCLRAVSVESASARGR